MVLDSLRAQEDRGRRLPGGLPAGQQQGEVQLLRREVTRGPSLDIAPGHDDRAVGAFDAQLDTDVGWAKYNAHYWRKDYRGFLEFFFAQCLPEPHSTKQIEDAVGRGLETDPETLIATQVPWLNEEELRELCARVRAPVLVVHGEDTGSRRAGVAGRWRRPPAGPSCRSPAAGTCRTPGTR